MSASATTPKLGLPLLQNNDHPEWGVDFNGAMNIIDEKFDVPVAINQRVSDLETSYANQATKISGLETDITAVQTNVNTVQSNLDSTNATVAENSTKINGITNAQGNIALSYDEETSTYYAIYNGDEESKKALGDISKAELVEALENSGLGITMDSSAEEIYEALKTAFPDAVNLLPFKAADSKLSIVGNRIDLTYVGSGSTEYFTTSAYTKSADLTNFTTLILSGSMHIGISGAADTNPFVQISLVKDGTQSRIIIAKTTGSNTSVNLSNYDISGVNGIYYLLVEFYNHNDPSYAIVDTALLTN